MVRLGFIRSQMTSKSSLCINEALTAIKCNDDIITEILLRLPLKSLIKSRSVCKWWYHLMSNPIFIANYSLRHPNLHVSGLFLQKFLLLKMYSNLKFIDFNGRKKDPMSIFSLSFIEDENGVFIQHSGNGLLLCSSFRCLENERIYYICQPTTKQYFTLPRLGSKVVHGVNIAFDPFKSSFIRVVCVVDCEVSTNHLQVKIYTSDEKLWRESGKPFAISDEVLFNRGVFWNGALHWVSRGDSSLRFDVEQELLLDMPMPPILEGQSERKLGYFGVSGEYLYMVHIYGSRTTVFDVMEMSSNYSGWFIKYHVDLTVVPLHYKRPVDEFSFLIMHLDHQRRRRRREVFYASAAAAAEAVAAAAAAARAAAEAAEEAAIAAALALAEAEAEAEQEQEQEEPEQEEQEQEEPEQEEQEQEAEDEEDEEEEEEFCMMLQFQIPGKIISYNLENLSFMELRDLSRDPLSSDYYLQPEYSWERVYPYINTLYYI